MMLNAIIQIQERNVLLASENLFLFEDSNRVKGDYKWSKSWCFCSKRLSREKKRWRYCRDKLKTRKEQ